MDDILFKGAVTATPVDQTRWWVTSDWHVKVAEMEKYKSEEEICRQTHTVR